MTNSRVNLLTVVPVNKQSSVGMSLIEVLVALLILGVAMLGAMGLQLNASEDIQTSYSRSQASTIALDLAERYRGNPDGQGTYKEADKWTGDIVARENAPSCVKSASDIAANNLGCSAQQMAEADIAEVRNNASEWLSGGSVIIQNCPADDAGQLTQCILVAWNGVDPAQCITGSQLNDCVVMYLYQ